MPVTQSLTQKVEILNTVQFKYEGQWETGAMSNVASVPASEPTIADLNNPNYIPTKLRKLELAKEGFDVKHLRYNKDSWNVSTDVKTNVEWATQPNVSAGLMLKKTTTYASTGNIIIKLDLSSLVKWNTKSYINWSLSQSNGFGTGTFEISYNNGSTWTALSKTVTLTGGTVVAPFPTWTKEMSMTGKSAWIRITLSTTNTSYSPVVTSFQVCAFSAYKTSGSWISKPIPVTDTFWDWDWPSSGTYHTPYDNGQTLYKEVSFDLGKTWISTSASPKEFLTNRQTGYATVPGINDPFTMIRFRMVTADTDVSPAIGEINFNFWTELPVIQLKVKESLKDRLKDFDFTMNSSKAEATRAIFADGSAYQKRVRVTRTVGSYNSVIYGFVNSKPRTQKYLDQESISVKCFDETQVATNYLFNDSWPKWNNSGVTWINIILDAWTLYGPKWIDLTGLSNNTNRILTEAVGINNVPVVLIGEKYGSLYDFMEKVSKITGYQWRIDNKFLKLWKQSDIVINNPSTGKEMVLEVNKNIVGVPQVDTDTPDISNVVYIPVRNRQTGFTQIMNQVINQDTYKFQYVPIARSFQKNDGTTVYIDPPPEICQISGGVYVKLVAAPEGGTDADKPETQVVYNLAERWFKLKAKPTADVADGLKTIYALEILGKYEKRNEESVKIFGERQHYISISSDKPSREEAQRIANDYLMEHSFPVTPVKLETTEFCFKVGDYVRVKIPSQDIDQVMPIVEINTISEGMIMDVELTLNKAPMSDMDLIIDMFKRIRELEISSDENSDVPTEKYKNFYDVVNIKDSFKVTLA